MKYADIIVANTAMAEDARQFDDMSQSALDKADAYEELAGQMRAQAHGFKTMAESLRRMAGEDFVPPSAVMPTILADTTQDAAFLAPEREDA